MAEADTPSGPAVVAITVKVRAGTQTLPPPAVGAYVTVYSSGSDVQAAAERSGQALIAIGLTVDELVPQVLVIRLDQWDHYVANTWPQVPGHFPTAAQMPAAVAGDKVVLSPFAGFNTFAPPSGYAPAR